MDPTLDDVREALSNHQPRTLPLAGVRRAAVAAILRQDEDQGLVILFIRRAEHRGDPWSGHMAFPGGRLEESDPSLLATAVRETKEEISLDLNQHATLLGELSILPAFAHGRPIPMVIAPFVFSVEDVPPFQLDPDEVQEHLWVPASFLLDLENRQTMKRKVAGVPMSLPCYHFEGRLIWGLTLRMVDELLRLVEV